MSRFFSVQQICRIFEEGGPSNRQWWSPMEIRENSIPQKLNSISGWPMTLHRIPVSNQKFGQNRREAFFDKICPTVKAYCTTLQCPNFWHTHFDSLRNRIKEESGSLVKDSQRRWIVLRHFYLSRISNLKTQRCPKRVQSFNKTGGSAGCVWDVCGMCVGCVWQDVTHVWQESQEIIDRADHACMLCFTRPKVVRRKLQLTWQVSITNGQI